MADADTPKASARVVAIHQEIGPDGSREVDVAFADGSFVRATISADRVGPIAGILQEGLLNRPSEGGAFPVFPEIRLVDTHIGHGADATELMVSTVEIGHVILHATDAALTKMRSEIDRLLALRAMPRGRQ